jgi:hypothetical protein
MKNIFLISIVFVIVTFTLCLPQVHAQPKLKERPYSLSPVNPLVFDANLKIGEVVEGLEAPTTMAFLGYNDFLILQVPSLISL